MVVVLRSFVLLCVCASFVCGVECVLFGRCSVFVLMLCAGLCVLRTTCHSRLRRLGAVVLSLSVVFMGAAAFLSPGPKGMRYTFPSALRNA